MSMLVPADKQREILEEPLEGYATFDFVGEASFGELTFKMDARVLVFCTDMGEGWQLGMLVDAEGNEMPEEDDHGNPRLTRGLIPQGFLEVRY